MEIQTIDIEISCRTCLMHTTDLVSLFETMFEGSALSEILKNLFFLDIDRQDKLSKVICESCKSNAINAHKFKQMCKDNDKRIRMIIDDSIKNDEIKTEDLTNQMDVSEDLFESSLKVCLQKDSHDDFLAEIKPDTEIESDKHELDVKYDSDCASSQTSKSNDGKCGILNCDLCDETFTSKKCLEKHVCSKHQSGNKRKSLDVDENESSDDEEDSCKIFSCDACPKQFKKPSLLIRHSKIHDPNKKPHECPKCNKRFPSQVALIRHDVLHSELVERSVIQRQEPHEFICVICGQSFKHTESLSSHLKSHKSDKTQDYTCILCLDNFPTIYDIVRHSKNHVENSTHQCVVCNKLFIMGDELIDHFLRHKEIKPFQCSICDKSFLKLHKLNVHKRTHSDDKLNSFLCPECGKSLSTNENLKRHLIRHTGIKPYACSLCPSRFVFKSGLTSHMSTHTGLKPFICDICGSSFTKSSSLTKHHRIHTGERPYVCEVCGMRFNSSDHVKRHMRTHTGERPYKCQYCDRSYAQSNDLLKHTRVHVGENTYKCNLCSAAYRLQAQLREHYRIHYDANTLLLHGRNETLDQKNEVTKMEIFEKQQKTDEQELQFTPQFDIIKNEQTENEFTENEQLMYQNLSMKK